MLLRLSIEEKPESQPDESQRASDHEGPTPSPVHCDPGNYERGDDGAEVCAGIEYSGGECSFFLGEPFGHCFDARRKNACLAKTQRGPGNAKPVKGPSNSVRHQPHAPESHAQRL